jgi:hypothetical protein
MMKSHSHLPVFALGINECMPSPATCRHPCAPCPHCMLPRASQVWEAVHKGVGYVVLGLAIGAIVTGLQVAEVRDSSAVLSLKRAP